MSEATTVESPKPKGRRIVNVILGLAIVGGAFYAIWTMVGQELWAEFGRFREEQVKAEDNAPIGYLGLNYRKSYNDRPLVFLVEKGGKKLLFAAKGTDGKPDEHYDVTEAEFDYNKLEGGFGKDSIPGVDYPIIETPGGARGRNVRDRQAIFGLELSQGSRVYTKEMLEKIELVNDVDGDVPIVVVMDRSLGKPTSYVRKLGDSAITLGTTGYGTEKKPLLYDRKTKSLWVPDADGLKCVSGPSKGARLAPHKPLTAATWAEWRSGHSNATIVVGSDRAKEIPSE